MFVYEPASAAPHHTTESERLDVLGSVITLRATSDATAGGCMTFDLEAAPGVGVPTHVHTLEDELFVVYEGTIRFEVDGREILVNAGESVFAPRNVPHTWTAIGEIVARATVTILPGRLDEMFRDLAALPAGVPDGRRVASICAAHGIRFV